MVSTQFFISIQVIMDVSRTLQCIKNLQQIPVVGLFFLIIKLFQKSRTESLHNQGLIIMFNRVCSEFPHSSVVVSEDVSALRRPLSLERELRVMDFGSFGASYIYNNINNINNYYNNNSNNNYYYYNDVSTVQSHSVREALTRQSMLNE